MSDADALNILYEDNHCLAVNKPAGIASAHFQEGGEQTLDRLVKEYLKSKYAKPGNVYLGVVHRLDKPVSGVLLFARTSKAAARLAEQFRAGAAHKVYWGVVEGSAGETGELVDWLSKDEQTGRTIVVAPATAGARRAELRYRRLGRYGGLSWLELQPRTGRRHQLRAQLAHQGLPIYGDVRYGARHDFGGAAALHARALTFEHPTRHEAITLTAEPPPTWRRFARVMTEKP